MTRPYPAWNAAVDDLFVCTAVRDVASDTKTVVFAPRRPCAVTFEAGQYATIEFDIDGSPVNRCYTISSPPTRPERLSITVKRTDGGRVSQWIHAGGLHVGSRVRIGEPQGSFTMTHHPADAYLLLTAGSGITPALSMLRTLYDLGTDRDVLLVHSQRHPDGIAYRDEIDWIARQLPGVRVRYVCTGADRADSTVVHGRMDSVLLRELAPDLAGREMFICGPDAYREAMRSTALDAGCPAGRIHQETFDLEAGDDVAAAWTAPLERGDAAPHIFKVDFSDLGATVECPEGTTVLEAASAAGLTLPSSCTQGLCGTCKSTLKAGEVDMQHAGGIRPREIVAGKFLLCCSRPLTDLVVGS